MPIYGHTYIVHNSVIFGPIPKNLYRDAHCSRDDYQPDRLFFGGWAVGCIIKFSFRRRPFTGAAKGVETPKDIKTTKILSY